MRKKVLSFIIWICCLHIIWMAGCSTVSTKSRPFSLNELAVKTGLVFPQSAYLKRSEMMQDYVGGLLFREGPLWAEIAMDRSDVEIFMKGAHERVGDVFSKDFRMREMKGFKPPEWWHPESVQGGLGVHAPAGAGFLELLITQDDGERATVYVQLFAD